MSVIWPLSKLFARAPLRWKTVRNMSNVFFILTRSYTIRTDGNGTAIPEMIIPPHASRSECNFSVCPIHSSVVTSLPNTKIMKAHSPPLLWRPVPVPFISRRGRMGESTPAMQNVTRYLLRKLPKGQKVRFFLFSHHSAKWRRIILVFCFSCWFVQCATTHLYGTAYVNISMGWAGEDKRQVLLRQAVQMGTVFVVGCVDRRNSYYRY